MKFVNILEFLELLKEIDIESRGNCKIVRLKDYDEETYKPLASYVDEYGNIDYCIEDIYNNGSDVEEIDLDSLEKLKLIINNLLKEEVEDE